MKFDPTFKPNRENLTPTIAAMMDRVFYGRRPLGQNVQFINEDTGTLDEWSFESADRAAKFSAQLTRQGRDNVVSN